MKVQKVYKPLCLLVLRQDMGAPRKHDPFRKRKQAGDSVFLIASDYLLIIVQCLVSQREVNLRLMVDSFQKLLALTFHFTSK